MDRVRPPAWREFRAAEVSRLQLERVIRRYLRFCFEHHTAARAGELAQILGMSQATLARLARRVLGVPIAARMKARQVEEAKKLLSESELPTEEIAKRAAFGTQNTFFRVFRLVTGMTPHVWRSRKK